MLCHTKYNSASSTRGPPNTLRAAFCEAAEANAAVLAMAMRDVAISIKLIALGTTGSSMNDLPTPDPHTVDIRAVRPGRRGTREKNSSVIGQTQIVNVFSSALT